MRKPLPSARRDGAVLPMVAICLVGLVGFVALAIDIGMMAVARTQAQSAADVAALAGARTLDGKTANNNRFNAEAEAVEAACANSILAARITPPQVVVHTAGVYRYDPNAQKFKADFQTGPAADEAYGAMRVRIVTDQDTYFGRVLGVNSISVAAEAAAVHRPRDIAISLDFSGSMKFSSEFNYPPNPQAGSPITGGLNPDPVFPRFGPWSIYPVATPGTPNPMHRVDAYIDAGGETHAVNNLTTSTVNGPPIVNNFQTTAVNNGPNAFTYNNDLSAGSFNISNTPTCTPAPSSWTSQYAPGYKGDRWPLKVGSSGTSPTLTDYAKTAADVTGFVTVTTSTRDPIWETTGYDTPSLSRFTNGPFQGYSMGPGYYGKTFYIWPPDPRYTAGADPLSISTTSPIQDTSGRTMADWRKRFFLAPSGSSTTKGASIADNSKLFGPTGQWNSQNLGGTLNYVPNYDAILAWIKTGPQTLPPALRAGRVCYYTQVPWTIPMNWSTGVISSSASLDQRFWKGYIDFVLGSGENARNMTLYGYDTDNTWGTSTFGTGKITPAGSLTGTTKPYMAYDDCPVHPRAHMWFGPLTMLAYLSIDSNNQHYNWFAGTTYESHCWQLKAGIQSALDDIKKNHPNDLASLNIWSSFDGYATPRVPMGRNYDQMKNCLFYPFSLVGNLGTVASEKVPYTTATASTSNPSGLDRTNYESDIPLADGGTNPTMGLMNSYNQFNWANPYTGRKGATKMVILETDGVANQKCNGQLVALGATGRSHWITVGNGGSAPSPMNGHPQALDPAVTLAWVLCQDPTGSKPWPNFQAYTAISGLGSTTPAKFTGWSGMSSTGPGFSTARNPARIHTLAFGYLFEPTTASGLKTRALEFLRNVQFTSGQLPDASTGTIENYKIIVGTYDQRIDKIRQAFERIMQSGVQVALIE
jgi:Flp pilus assembly protein TadG